MRRAFASLYVVIVAAILIIGWGMDAAWEAYTSEPILSEYEKALLRVLEERISGLDDEGVAEDVTNLNQELEIELKLYQLDDFSSTEIGVSILQGALVPVVDKHGSLIVYKKVSASQNDYVLALTQKGKQEKYNLVYFVLLLAFYSGLALVIFVWVWPLSRDLNLLEKHIRNVGEDGVSSLLQLRIGSHVQTLVDAFNSMSVRIKELLQSRKEMTYAVSHEIRTPLARMKFALEMADDSKNIDELRRQLSGVRDDVDALDKFVSELLSYASFDQGQQSLQMESGNFVAFCESIIAEQKVNSISINLHAVDKNIEISCDWQLIERVLVNLLENAARYAKSQILIELRKGEQNLDISIEDDGPGIALSDREKVFQSFVRLQSSAGGAKGYGLGLAIVKRIMQWHGGEVQIKSSSLGGACFSLSLPSQH